MFSPDDQLEISLQEGKQEQQIADVKSQKEIKDLKFSAKVSKYFSNRKESETSTEDDDNWEAFLSQSQRSLEKLADPKQLEKTQPGDIALALSELTGVMAARNPEYSDDPQAEKAYNEAKEIFMSSCAKMFPDKKADFTRVSLIVDKLRKSSGYFDTVPEIKGVNILLRENPKELAKKINDVLFNAGNMAKERAFLTFDETNGQEIIKHEAELSRVNEAMYELQLIRDALQKKIYGRPDTTTTEAKEIDKIRSELNAENTLEGKKNPQEWLNKNREQAYKDISSEMRANLEKGKLAGEYLYNLIEFGMDNPMFKERFEKELKRGDIETISYLEITSDSASLVAGKEIKRGIFIVENKEIYNKLQKVFLGREGNNRGVVISGRAFGQLPNWREVGVILTDNDPATVSHEIRHTIDPNIHERSGYNCVIAEIFAFYQECVVSGNNNWAMLEYRVSDDVYYEGYSEFAKQKITKAEWRQNIKKLVEKIKILRQKYDDVELQRVIAKAKTIDQILSY